MHIHFRAQPELYFKEGDLWWVSLGENIGSEANGKNFHFERPVVILKKFSADMLFAIPTTTQNKTGSWYHPVDCNGTITLANLAQGRTISSKRFIRKIGNLPKENLDSITESFIALIKANPPT